MKNLTCTRALLVVAVAYTILVPIGRAFKPPIHRGITYDALGAISANVGSHSVRFSPSAMRDVGRADAQTDLYEYFTPYRHFTDERFAAASSYLAAARTAIVAAITATPPNGRLGRQRLGQALHTLQDFYAHSNWAELVAAGSRAGIWTELGQVTVADPPATTGFVHHGDFLPAYYTTPTTGYFVGDLGCWAPAYTVDKCYHGSFLCPDGIHKDSPERNMYAEARDLATQASVGFVQLILNDASVVGNDRAIRALMGIGPTLGIVIDDTGSMGSEIAQVKSSVAQIVASVAGTASEPCNYVLVRFGDPDVGPAFATEDSTEFMNHVNALTADGGGDCPELAMEALMQAIGACLPDSTIYLFTDADAKDDSRTSSVLAAARKDNISVTSLLTGFCSSGVSPSTNPLVYVAESTGGQWFSLASWELYRAFDLVEPELAGDLVTIRRAEGTFATGPVNLDVPVDSTASRAMFTFTGSNLASMVFTRPSGQVLAMTDPGVDFTQLSNGVIVTLTQPEIGLWHLSVGGYGDYTIAVQANSQLELESFEFVEFSAGDHGGYFPIDGQPVAGQGLACLADVLGTVQDASLDIVGLDGNLLQPPTTLTSSPDTAPGEYLGGVTPPTQPFRIQLRGVDSLGHPCARLYPQVFEAQVARVQVDASTALIALPPGEVSTLRLRVLNLGAVAEFAVAASNDRGFVSTVEPETVLLGTGEEALVDVSTSVPAGTPEGTTVNITVTATDTSDAGSWNGTAVRLAVHTAAVLTMLPPAQELDGQVLDGGRLDHTPLMAFGVRCSGESVDLRNVTVWASGSVDLGRLGELSLHLDSDADGQVDPASEPIAVARFEAPGLATFVVTNGTALSVLPVGETAHLLATVGDSGGSASATGTIVDNGWRDGRLCMAVLLTVALGIAILFRRERVARPARLAFTACALTTSLLMLNACTSGQGSTPLKGTLRLHLTAGDVLGFGVASSQPAIVNGAEVDISSELR